MKCERGGTRMRTAKLLKEHFELMTLYMKGGMSKDEASKKAYYELTSGKGFKEAMKHFSNRHED